MDAYEIGVTRQTMYGMVDKFLEREDVKAMIPGDTIELTLKVDLE